MPRADETAGDLPGGDSFLDVVANIVGILVLLVVVVGVRAGQQITEESSVAVEAVEVEPLEEINEETAKIVRQAQLDQRDLLELRDQVAQTAAEAARRNEAREAQTWYVTKLRAELDEARENLDGGDQRSLDTHNAIAQAELKYQRLTRDMIALSAIEPEPDVETVVVAPTPIVDGKADRTITFRLKDGRLLYIPVDEAIAELAKKAQPPAFSDPSERVLTENTVGPIDGFEAKGVFAWATLVRGNRIGINQQLIQMRLDEITPLTGEALEDAFAIGGYVASRIELLDANEYVVRLMIYPDSFEDVPEVERRFREKGYRIAKSLKAAGEPIGFSANGYQAVTQ